MSQHRLLPTTEQDKIELLKACGVSSIEDLLVGIPSSLKIQNPLKMNKGLSELEIKRKIHELTKTSKNTNSYLSFLGAGAYDHFCPSVVNQLTLRGEYLTSYTPYQPEMSQGLLQSLFEFQSMIAEIFGMEVSNASHYDGSTSLAESVLMALRIKNDRKRILVSAGVHPEYVEVLKTYITHSGVELTIVPLSDDGKTSQSALKSLLGNDVATVLVQSPNFLGCVENMSDISDIVHSKNSLFSVNVTEPLSLALLKSPGECQADIATGEGQSFGLPSSFGGPYVGLFTTKMEYVRQIPGRLCGETVDALNRRSYTLTLSTREQHIRREKATSNICTNQNLCALMAAIWLSLVGKEGFIELAEHNVAKTEYAKSELSKTGKASIRYSKTPTFNEFVLDLKCSASDFVNKAIENGIAPGLLLQKFNAEDKNGLLISVTEKKSRDDIDALVELVKRFA